MNVKAPMNKLRDSKVGIWARTGKAAAGSAWDKLKNAPYWVRCGMILLYRLILDLVYLTQMVPIYGYMEFTRNLRPLSYGTSWLMLLICLPLVAEIHRREDRPSHVIVTVLNYLYFLPMSSYTGCSGSALPFLVSGFVFWFVLLLLQLRIPSLQWKVPSVRFSRKIYRILTIGAVVFVMGVSGVYTGFRFTLNFVNVYDIRSEAAAYSMPGVVSYVLAWMPVVLSVLLLYWLRERKVLIVAGLIVVYLFYFSIGAHKTVFFFLILLLGCYFLYRNWMYRLAPGLLSLGVLACGFVSAAFGFLIPLGFVVNRSLYLPVLISEKYADFFSQHPLNVFREGILSKVSFDPIYSSSIPYVIGDTMYKASGANNGLLGDVYANLPASVGVLVLPLILILCFRLLDLAASRRSQKFYMSFCIYFAYCFLNVSWSTVLLTNGFLLACVLLYLFPQEGETGNEVL